MPLDTERRQRRGLGKPETFLGFTFKIRRKTRRDRMRAKLKTIKEEMWRRMHHSIPDQGKWLRRVVQGYFNYYAVPTNAKALVAFRHHVTDLWRRTLRRRSQKDGFTWARMTKLADDWLPKPTILHPSAIALPSHTRGGSRMRESRLYGFVRGGAG